MTDFPPSIPALVRDTIRDPRQTAARILSWNLPTRVLWDLLALGVLLTVVMLVGLVLLTTQGATDPTSQMMLDIYGQPFVVAAGQGINAVVSVYALYWIGRTFGGVGSLEGGLALIAWHQIFLLILGLVGMVVGTLMPSVMSFLLIGMIGLYFYVLTQFVCVLHGFPRAGPVFGVMVVSILTIYLVVSIALTFLSVLFLGGGPNV